MVRLRGEIKETIMEWNRYTCCNEPEKNIVTIEKGTCGRERNRERKR